MRKTVEWYDRKGNPLVTAEYKKDPKAWEKQMVKVEKLLRDKKYKRVAEDNLWWGGWLSTVWMGLDHDLYGKGRPLIFETMLFFNGSSIGDECRYSTERQAKNGHRRLKEKWSSPRVVIPYFFHSLITKIKTRLERRR